MVTLSGKDANRFLKTETSPISKRDRKIAEDIKKMDWDQFDKEIQSENKKLEIWTIRNYGLRCPEYYKGCIVCEKWKLFDKLKMEV